MNTRDDQLSAPNAQSDRASRLSAAILGVNGSLDVATALQEVADSARALTGARFGIITTIDKIAEVRESVTSGFTAAERRRMEQWEDGPRLFEHLVASYERPQRLLILDFDATDDPSRSLNLGVSSIGNV